MIINSLVRRYEKQAEEGKIARRGWSKANVTFGLRISENGEIADIIDLRTEVQRGKKTVVITKEVEVPEQAGKTSKIMSNFLCDKSDYILGIDGKNKQFEVAKGLHQEILLNCNSSAAKAVKNFFEKWKPSEIENFPKLQENLKELQKGAKIIFMFGENFVSEDAEIKTAWENYKQKSTDLPLMQCLITGEILPIARIHPKINHVKDAHTSGASIVTFNANAFESYGRDGEQNLNAPISEYASFAYTTALNDLLSDSEHRKVLGDMTVVYWAEENSSDCQNCLSEFLYPNEELSNQTLNTLIEGIKDKKIIFNGTKLDYDNPFYILGLSPNVSRLSVRFFLQKSFGEVVKNISKHYEDLKIIKPTFKKFEYIPLWQILNATVSSKSKDKSVSPLMSGAVVSSIMTGKDYPVSLFQNTILRIKSERVIYTDYSSMKIFIIKVAIIKSYLTRNKGRENLMALDENSNDRNYVLGRIFAVFEAIQDNANPGINSTIKDKYFNSACSNPDRIFPILQKLSIHHFKKLETGTKIYFKKQLTNLTNKLELTEKNSSLLTLEEQGIFILGYYHQTQERYKSKEEKENG